MPIERDIQWTGDPICYNRKQGSALIVGRYHYLFDESGQMISMQPVTRPVLAQILSALYPDHAMAMAAHVKVIKAPKPEITEDMMHTLEEQLQDSQSMVKALHTSVEKFKQENIALQQRG